MRTTQEFLYWIAGILLFAIVITSSAARLPSVLCGECPAGLEREGASFPYCGKCIHAPLTCAPGFYQHEKDCKPCPCPSIAGARRFGNTCYKDVDGHVTCNCHEGYVGRDCRLCAPSYIQNDQYPYNCYLQNTIPSNTTICSPGEKCPSLIPFWKDYTGLQINNQPEYNFNFSNCNTDCSYCTCIDQIGNFEGNITSTGKSRQKRAATIGCNSGTTFVGPINCPGGQQTNCQTNCSPSSCPTNCATAVNCATNCAPAVNCTTSTNCAPTVNCPTATNCAPTVNCPTATNCAPTVNCPTATNCAPTVNCPTATNCAPTVNCPTATNCAPTVNCPTATNCAPTVNCPTATNCAPTVNCPTATNCAPTVNCPTATNCAPAVNCPTATNCAPTVNCPTATNCAPTTNPCPVSPCPVTPCPVAPCPVTPCPTNPCPSTPCPVTQCPVNPCQPCASVVSSAGSRKKRAATSGYYSGTTFVGPINCPGGQQTNCSPSSCPTSCVTAANCPTATNCAPTVNCLTATATNCAPTTICSPTVTCATNPCPVTPCPVTPCPVSPCPVTPCPVVPCPVTPCPVCPVNPCPACPTTPCPSPCPSPCPQCPVNQPCPNPCPSPCRECPSPCPSPCPSQCPTCPSPCRECPSPCPSCPPTPPCYPCPNPCPPCPPGRPCPNCPTPCQECPKIPPCPQCPGCNCSLDANFSCNTETPCICDPRGTMLQSESECFCKVNVEGYDCGTCKKGYFGLRANTTEGCLKCFGSGVSTYCTSAVFYRDILIVSGGTLEISQISSVTGIHLLASGISYIGGQARHSVSTSSKLLWSLPSVLLGNRLTSYGGGLFFSRHFTGGGTALGADHDVIIVGRLGVVIYWSSFTTFPANTFSDLKVTLDETAGWVTDLGGISRTATREDILTVLADVQAIYVRASFTSMTSSTTIKGISLETVSRTATVHGFTLLIEQCSCPIGYQGLSCESCSAGFYRDLADMSRSVFGACKKCPCGQSAAGCTKIMDEIICNCRDGYTGHLCQDKETMTITLDPFRIRDCINSKIDYTCTYATTSLRAFTVELVTNPPSVLPAPVTSTTYRANIQLTTTLSNVICRLRDNTGDIVGEITGSVVTEPCTGIIIPPPPIITILSNETFICVNETTEVILRCSAQSYGSTSINIQWRKEGLKGVLRTGNFLSLPNSQPSDSGTYICSATVVNITAIQRIALVVRSIVPGSVPGPYPINSDDPSALNTFNGTVGSYILSILTTAVPSKLTQNDSRTPENKLSKGYPEVTIEPSSLKVREGENISLQCHAKGERPLKFHWKSSRADYIPVHARASAGALIFESVKKADEGDYICIAWNHRGQAEARATLLVDKTAFSISLAVPEYAAHAGENVHFKCLSENHNARLIWSRKFGELPQSSEVKADGVLTLYRVSEKDTGIYICTGLSANGHKDQKEAILTIQQNTVVVPPTVKLNPRSPHKVHSGHKVVLECQGSGEPSPTVQWTRVLEGHQKQLSNSTQATSVLEITHVTKEDEGKYTCTAMNRAGNTVESLTLLVDNVIVCKTTEFRCKSGDQCILKSDRCDDKKDCPDGSDENHCNPRTRHLSQ